jgi:hypothetical protein
MEKEGSKFMIIKNEEVENLSLDAGASLGFYLILRVLTVIK